MLDVNEFKSFIELHEEKKRLEAEVKLVKDKIAKLQPDLIQMLEQNDMSKISILGKTCYIKAQTFAQIRDRASAIEVLRKAGYGEYVKEGINSQSVSALVRHLLEEEGILPEIFGEIITAGNRVDLGLRAA